VRLRCCLAPGCDQDGRSPSSPDSEEMGNDSGAMMAVDAELASVKDLLAKSGNGSDPSIACYNCHRRITLAGTTKVIELAEAIAKQDPSFSSMRSKRLNVTNAFHSVLVDNLHDELQSLGKCITFNDPTIRFERVTEDRTTEKPDLGYVAYRMRNPVYFDHAVQRPAKEFAAAIWLEVGSNSMITTMASQTLSSSGSSSSSSLHAVNITTDNSFELLVDTTATLWKGQLNVTFWPHHRSQTHQYTSMAISVQASQLRDPAPSRWTW
jgi:acyl transferase domain-containing protein